MALEKTKIDEVYSSFTKLFPEKWVGKIPIEKDGDEAIDKYIGALTEFEDNTLYLFLYSLFFIVRRVCCEK